MLQNTQIPSVIILFFKKAISYDSGSLLLISAATGSTFSEILKVLFSGIEQRDIFLPLFYSSGTFAIYILLFLGDFFTGLRASRHEARINQEEGFLQSSKLWRSFWKFYGVASILFVLTGFTLMTATLSNQIFYNIFLISIPSIMLMVILFEFHSIGENIKRRFGHKPSYFEFLDNLSKAVENGIIKKVSNWF